MIRKKYIPLIDPLDNPFAPFGVGCSNDPSTCQNQFLCICEEQQEQSTDLIKNNSKKGIKDENI